jgi:hypothetical protein
MNDLMKFDGQALATIERVEDLNQYINDVLARYDETRNVKLNWDEYNEDPAKRQAQSLSKMVSISQDKREMGKTSKEDKAARTAEFRAVRGVFINEKLNDLIEAFYRKLGYQSRFTGIAKNGTGSVQFVPPSVASKDAVGKAAKALQGAQGEANLAKYLQSQGLTARQLEAIKSGDKVIDVKMTVTQVAE